MATSASAGKLRALGSASSSVESKLTRHHAAPEKLLFGFAERHSRIAGEGLHPSMVDTSWDQLPCLTLCQLILG